MPTLKNPKQEQFAQMFAHGDISAAACYRKLNPKANKKSCETHGPRMARLKQIKNRCQELRDMANAELEKEVVFEVKDAMRFCIDVIQCNIRDLGSDSPLIQSFEQKEFGAKITVCSKLDALDKLAKLNGWYAAEKIDVKGLDPTISEAVAKRFKRKA